MDWNRRIVETSAGGLWVTDLEGRTVDANAAAAALLGVTPAQLAEASHGDFLDAEGRVQFAAHLADLREGRVNKVEVDCLFHRPDGTGVWVVLREALLRDDDGTVTGVLMNVDDISARKRLLSDLQHSEQQRVAAERVARLGSWHYDPSDRAFAYSDGVAELYGARTAAVFASYDSFVDAVHPDDRSRVVDALAGVTPGEPAFDFEARMLAEQGWIWIHGRGLFTLDDHGARGPVVGTLLDVTELRDTDEALRDLVKQNALMSAIATRANEATTLTEVLLDSRSLLLQHDEWDRARAFVPAPEGDDLVEIVPDLRTGQDQAGEDRAGVDERERATARRCLREGRAVWDDWVGLTLAFPVMLREAVAAVVTMTSRPPLRRHALIESMALQVADQLARVADRERVAQELADARDRALEASHQKSAFLSTMSHEIRTPLNGVLGLTELLGRTGLDERQRHLISGIDLSGRALLAVINEVLDFSKIEAGHLELESVDLEVRAVLDQVAGMLAEPARAQGLELIVSCSPEVPQLLSGDPSRLAQVLANLGSNAVKFTPSGRVDIRATHERDPSGQGVLRVEVRDTGVGIPAEAVEAVFQPFAQADASTTRRFGGTGLGLAISREIVEAMGGRLGVDTEPGTGSTFWFTVPACPPQDAVVDEALRRARELLGGLRLLVVDDAASGRPVLAEQLAWWGVAARTVTGARAAEQVLAEGAEGVEGAGRLGAILLDVTTTEAETFALADRLEAAGRAAGYPRLPVVLLTSALPPDDAALAGHGIDHCLTRPIASVDLRDVLLRVAGLSHTPAPTSPNRPPTRPERLLVVEDNQVNRIVASGFAAALGFVAETAEDGLRALEMLEDADYDLVLMDVQMPGIDGYETTRLLRAREAARGGRRTPVVAMTAAALEDERQRALDAGLDDYLTKPVTGARIAAMIERWVTAVPTSPPGSAAGSAAAEEDRCLDAARLAELRDLLPGGDYLRRAVESFIDRAGQLEADVREAADPEALSGAAHALRGSAANLGAALVSELAERLESQGRAGRGADPGQLAALGAAMTETTAALRRYHARTFTSGPARRARLVGCGGGRAVSRHEVDVCVLGAGQAGLAVGYHLQRLARLAAREGRPAASVVLLDDRDGPGGAWREGWDTLALFSPAAYSSLPGRPMPPWPGPGNPSAAHVVAYLGDYERRYDLPVRRPVRVVAVADRPDGRLLVRAGDDEWVASVLVNATGTWSRPFRPHLEGAGGFAGRQLHTADYRGVGSVRGPRVAVVGGGNSGAQIAADLLLHTTHEVTWCTREPPVYLPDDVDGRVLFETATRAVQAQARGGVDAGVRGLGDIVVVPSVREARDERGLCAVGLPERWCPDGAVWPDGTRRRLDTVVWCTGFRPALAHLRGLALPRVAGHPGPGDPRVLFVGYGEWTGPASATLIGVNASARRTAREAVDLVSARPRPTEPRRPS